MYDLSGRVAIVFGAGSSGPALSNGEAAARAYARAGAKVVCVDIDAAEARRVAKEIENEGGEAIGTTANVTRVDDVEAAVANAVDQFDRINILHNNVGVARTGSIEELTLSDWEATVQINLTSAFLTAKACLPHLLRTDGGVVTNVSSLASIRETGYPYPAYNATKAGLNQLTVSIALTYARRGLRANAVLPGLIDTPLVSKQLVDDPADLEARHARSPTGRMGSPWDIANAAVFLASDHAAYINGVCLPVDGGLSSLMG